MAQKQAKRKTILHPKKGGRKPKRKKGEAKRPLRYKPRYWNYDPPITSTAALLMLKDPAIRLPCSECRQPIEAGGQRRYIPKNKHASWDGGPFRLVCLWCAEEMSTRGRA